MDDCVHGIFNAAKCARYLRSIGVEISEAQEQQWHDAQAAHRFLRGMKRTQREGWDWWCEKGHQRFHVVDRRQRRSRRKRIAPDVDERCPQCGGRWSRGKCRWAERRDGTLMDYRTKDERWKALDWQPPPVGADPPPEMHA